MYPYLYARPGLLSRGLSMAKAINWSGLLDGTQKTLGVINQAIPIVYQVKPIINNARTMFKIADEIRTPSGNSSNSNINRSSNGSTSVPTTSNNQPIFYI